MDKVKIVLKRSAIDTWVSGAGITLTELAKECNISKHYFLKIMSGSLEPTKMFIKGIMNKTGYKFEALFYLDKN